MVEKARKRVVSLLLLGFLLLSFPGFAAAIAIDFSDASGYGLGSDLVKIDNIRVDYELANPFDPTRPTIQSFYYNVPFRFDNSNYHLVPTLESAAPVDNTTNCADTTIMVTNAFNGDPVLGAAVTVGGRSGFSDSAGIVIFNDLTSGQALISATAPGYSAADRTATLSCTQQNSVGVALNPTSGTGALQAGEVRVTLTWGENPSDLDSHLTGPLAGTASEDNRFHVYFGNSVEDVANLDVDDVTSFGPETITITPPSGSSVLRPGIYRYTIHHWSGSASIPTSGASIALTIGSQTRQFTPPAGSLAGAHGDIWTVFELSVAANGSITVLPVNTYASGVSSGSVRSTATGYGEIETGVDFNRLSK